MIASMVAGFLWSGLGLPVPGAMDETLALLGSSATPCALFAIGASLAGRSAERPPWRPGFRPPSWSCIRPRSRCRRWRFFRSNREAAGVMIAAAALPVAGNIYILAQHYRVAPQRVSTAILFSTAASILTLPLVIAWV
jgi:malonate transporter